MNKILLNIGIYFGYVIICSLIFFGLSKANDGGFAVYPMIASAFFLGLHLLGTLALSISKFQDKALFKEYIISFLLLLLIGLPGCFFNFLLLISPVN
ncbi:MAG TPA: hypothetical protein PL048_01890 [Leptospiraceae bacterium]|nr:hypothetical protein [Leptospiraceae bacterium]HMY68284.1 hypothetical protein [Leptospiraceae bacterium]HMZ57494.1 hypothetical protein [Leptospiraceae bacterium]HNF13246.1 hypothetical protein [Leptospiraceae bacterium]HNF23698.1 hypothetical protein [Leptospiraceae bacterium]